MKEIRVKYSRGTKQAYAISQFLNFKLDHLSMPNGGGGVSKSDPANAENRVVRLCYSNILPLQWVLR